MNQDNYTNQDGCHNCTKCVSYWDYSKGDIYVCSLTEKRPNDDNYKTWEEFYEADRAWEGRNEVKPWGICGKFKKSKIKE